MGFIHNDGATLQLYLYHIINNKINMFLYRLLHLLNRGISLVFSLFRLAYLISVFQKTSPIGQTNMEIQKLGENLENQLRVAREFLIRRKAKKSVYRFSMEPRY